MKSKINPFDKEYFEELYDSSDELPWQRDFIPKFLKEFATTKKGKLLDVGCGDGTNAKYFHDKGFYVVGIDYSQKVIEIAQKKHPKIKFLVRDATELIGLGVFDVITSLNLIHHLTPVKIKKHMRQVNKILSPKGTYLMLCFSGNGYEKGELERERYCPTKDELIRWLKNANFQLVRYQNIPSHVLTNSKWKEKFKKYRSHCIEVRKC